MLSRRLQIHFSQWWPIRRQNPLRVVLVGERFFPSQQQQDVLRNLPPLRRLLHSSVAHPSQPLSLLDSSVWDRNRNSHYPWLLTSRSFATRIDERQPLANERLVAALLKNAGTSADDLKVRMIFQTKEGKSAETKEGKSPEIVSLTRAIQMAVELQQDLIGIALSNNDQQEIPVVKVDSLKRLAYQQARKSNNRKGQAPVEKEFRFKTGIADNDLERKVSDMYKFLEKGHNCMVGIRGSKRELTKDPDAALTLAAKVRKLVSNVGELESKLKVNPNKTMVRFLLRPTTN